MWFCGEQNKTQFLKCGSHPAVLLWLLLASSAINLTESSELFELDDGTEFHEDGIQLKRQSETCFTPEKTPGQCLPRNDCLQYVKLARFVTILPDVANYLRSAICRLPSSPKRQQQQWRRSKIGFCCNQAASNAEAVVDAKDSLIATGPLQTSAQKGKGKRLVLMPDPVTKKLDADEKARFKQFTDLRKDLLSDGRQLFPTSTCGQSYRLHDKIVGGAAAEKHAWPWLALIGYQPRPNLPAAWKCGGTLITDEHVLTAAHCLADPDNPDWALVRLGEHNLEDSNETPVIDVPIEHGIIHETFLVNTNRYSKRASHHGFDIAILVLRTAVVFQAGVISPICLPMATLRSGVSQDLVKKDVWAAGWGATEFRGESSSHLMEVQINIMPEEKCRRSYSFVRINITDRMFCAGSSGGGKDTCQGDSGGPLMVSETVEEREQYYQLGVVSFGNGCGLAKFPGVYTRVSSFMDWIEKKVREST